MADTVLIKPANIDAPMRRRRRILTTENNYYLRKIEQLANTRLRFFRDQELREETNKSKAGSTSVTAQSTSVVGGEGTDHKKKKKRKVPKKAVRTPVVSNEITERLKEFIVNEMKGTDVKVVIQKMMYKSDTLQSQNRLSMPINQLETDEFLTADERRFVSQKDNKIKVSLVGPTLEMYKMKMELTMWHMSSTMNYVLKTHWYEFWLENKEHLEEDSKIQVWSFRRGQQLCFAVACVEKPDAHDDDVV